MPIGAALQKLSLQVLATEAGAVHNLSPAMGGRSLDLHAPVERVGPRDQVEGGPLRGRPIEHSRRRAKARSAGSFGPRRA
jgi:hypothetical protein